MTASDMNRLQITSAFCGGVLVVLGTRLLSGSAHGCCLLTSRKVKSRRKCWKLKMMKRRKVKQMERSKRESLNVRMKHGDDDETNKAQTSWNQSKNSKKQRLRRHYEDEGSSMHEDSCVGINYIYAHTHVFPKCFESLHTLLGFVLCFVSSIEFLSL